MIAALMVLYGFISCGLSQPSTLPLTNEARYLMELPDIEALDQASIYDLRYRLDLVDCPRATEVEGSSITYKTIVYYNFWYKKYRCCSWEKPRLKTPITLDENNQAIVTGQYDQGLVQRISFKCPIGGGCWLSDLYLSLPPPVRLGGKAVCIDSLLFVHNELTDDNGLCEFCGDTYTNTCWKRIFNHISVTFRSSYRSLNTSTFEGFRFKINWNPHTSAAMLLESIPQATKYTTQTDAKCLEEDPQGRLTSDMYLNTPLSMKEVELEASLLTVSASPQLIPYDALETLDEYSQMISTGVTNNDMFRLASLCQRSCDKAVAILAKNILDLLENQ